MRRPSSSERGLTFVTVLMLLALAAAVYWVMTFGNLYWENHELKSVLRQAANIAYQQKDNGRVREWILREFNDNYGYDGEDASGHHARLLKMEFEENDLRLERVESPPLMRIDFHYVRTITLPIFGGQRRIAFDDHIEQDLSAVKW